MATCNSTLLEEIDEQRKRIARLENVQAGLLERGIQLEQLCRDLYGRITYYNDVHDRLRFDNRMDALGLLEGGDND